MPIQHQDEIEAILREGQDMTVATVMPDGAPHATTVSYASDGLKLYFGCSPASQKAQNLGRDGRVALTINLPYHDWSQIRGVSVLGRAKRLEPGDAMDQAALLFASKFSEIAQYISSMTDEIALFEVTPETISLLDYGQGFGHVDHIRAA